MSERWQQRGQGKQVPAVVGCKGLIIPVCGARARPPRRRMQRVPLAVTLCKRRRPGATPNRNGRAQPQSGEKRAGWLQAGRRSAYIRVCARVYVCVVEGERGQSVIRESEPRERRSPKKVCLCVVSSFAASKPVAARVRCCVVPTGHHTAVACEAKKPPGWHKKRGSGGTAIIRQEGSARPRTKERAKRGKRGKKRRGGLNVPPPAHASTLRLLFQKTPPSPHRLAGSHHSGLSPTIDAVVL